MSLSSISAGGWWIAPLAVVVTVLALIGGLAVLGFSPGAVIAVAAAAALGGRDEWAAIFHDGLPLHFALSLQQAGPLALCGLATALAFRCGVLNIGVEGQYRIGALAAITVGTLAPGPGWFALTLALGAAALAGAMWAGIAAHLEHWRGVPVVLSTILLNFVAALLVSLLVGGVLRAAGTTAPQTAELVADHRLPVLVAGTKLRIARGRAQSVGVAAGGDSGRGAAGAGDGDVGGTGRIRGRRDDSRGDVFPHRRLGKLRFRRYRGGDARTAEPARRGGGGGVFRHARHRGTRARMEIVDPA